ncbi:hypothetical protein SAMD00019534_080770 [Acytostelium subglobosum LB1]|uniref:hypothetical protein n=1 Tax=Acytostelium subglobosum LB1 TaxID=1410327 RepID=UPI0006449ACA|nr:hypothetical protein SAMD00019534_080770 [Acytostelium subglobosum LB1]GAM24902.1 hypothetical protein SAMD00019534_080770 [Acytostelium subglobosum LB1]|eukprot:XP_012751991.1 hypothetical protein SAMD00019534_080770 [Acytostelium subglobosum LB1]
MSQQQQQEVECPETLRLKGNQLFAKGEFDEALKVYARALECAPNDFTIISNQSACYFELGLYSDSIEASNKVRAMIVEQGGQDPKQLDKKNLARIAKALFTINDRDNLITLLNDHSADLKGSSPEMDKIITSIEHENKRLPADAPLTRVNNLPRNLPVRCSTGEYFVMGHDQPISALGCQFEPVDETDVLSEKDGDLTRYHQRQTIQLAEHPELSIFFGGCNDGRHALITYADLNRQVSTMPDNTKVHITLNDIKATSLARNVVLTHLLHSLGAFNSINAIYTDKQAALDASLIYFMYFSVAMPGVTYQRLIQVIDELLQLTHVQLPNHMVVDKQSWKMIRRSLNYWRSEHGFTAKRMRAEAILVPKKETTDEITMGSSSTYQAAMSERAKERQAMIEQIKDYDYVKQMMPDLTPEAFEAMKDDLAKILEDDFEGMTRMTLPSEAKPSMWSRIYKLIPMPKPLMLCDGLSEFDRKAGEAYQAFNIKDPESLDKSLKKSLFDDNWEPNITFLDIDFKHLTGLNFDPVNSLTHFVHMKWLGEPEMSHTEHFDYFINVVFQAARGLRQLADRKYITVEFDVGDMNKTLERIRIDEDKSRMAKNLPNQFDRIFLTNVPDYTGQLIVFVDTINSLKLKPHAFIKFNVILNTGLFKDYEEAVHSHTLIPSITQAHKYFGMRCIEDYLWQVNTWTHAGPKKLPLESLAKRDEIWLWLVRVFINIMLPAKINPADVVTFNCPNNMSIFFRILDRLRDIGYPLHWLTSFIDQLLSGSVKSAAALSDKRMIPVGAAQSPTPKTINTMAFQVELRTIASLWLSQSLNARITTPLPNPSDIHQWKISSFGMTDNMMGIPFAVQQRPVYSALIYLANCPKQYRLPTMQFGPANMVDKVVFRKAVLDTVNTANIIQFITVIEWSDLDNSLTFWMSQSDMDSLISQKASIVLYRNDIYREVSNTLPLSQALRQQQSTSY